MTFNRPEIIRPPSEWQSYYLPLTSGCSNNTCTFCNYYGSKLQMRDLDEVKREIEAVALYVTVLLPNAPSQPAPEGPPGAAKKIELMLSFEVTGSVFN